MIICVQRGMTKRVVLEEMMMMMMIMIMMISGDHPTDD